MNLRGLIKCRSSMIKSDSRYPGSINPVIKLMTAYGDAAGRRLFSTVIILLLLFRFRFERLVSLLWCMCYVGSSSSFLLEVLLVDYFPFCRGFEIRGRT